MQITKMEFHKGPPMGYFLLSHKTCIQDENNVEMFVWSLKIFKIVKMVTTITRNSLQNGGIFI